jgi:ribonuclease HI
MSEITIWLGASCQGPRGPGAWGAVFQGSNGQRMKVSGSIEDATPSIAHVRGLWEALSRIKKTGVTVDIHTNSDHLVNWISGSWNINDPYVGAIIKQCKEMCESKYLNVSWFLGTANPEAKSMAQAQLRSAIVAGREQLANALTSLQAINSDDLPPWE